MSKIRNSLGVLVLPVPNKQLTWEQYKDKFGIDLASSLGLRKTSSGNYVLNFPRKLIYLDDVKGAYFDVPLQPVFAINGSAIQDGQEIIGTRYLIPYIGYGQSLEVVGELQLSIYKDPDTPNTIYYTEI